MSKVFSQAYRLEICPFPIPGGESVPMQIGNFHGGTTHMTSLFLLAVHSNKQKITQRQKKIRLQVYGKSTISGL